MTHISSESTVSLQEVTEKTLRSILRLDVSEHQKNFVASNATSIAQAYFQRDSAWFRGIYADDTPVGFLMLYEDQETPVYFLWRLMIDQRYQRMGFGRQAVLLLADRVRGLPGAVELKVSYAPGQGNPQPFYHSLGFVDTGEIDDGEHVMALPLAQSSQR